MKKSSTRISANELNRFMYCPNQWYYKRVYGAKSLTQMYEALDIEHSEHTEHFTKGMSKLINSDLPWQYKSASRDCRLRYRYRYCRCSG